MFAGLLAGVTVTTGCQTLDDAQHVADQRDLAGDLATRMERADELTYTAEYQLAGGALATIAQAREPARVAYTYSAGKLIMMPDSATDCLAKNGAMTCTVTTIGSPDPGPAAALPTELTSRGMITPSAVVALLNATTVDPDAEVQQQDTTIAGQHATCVTVSAVDNAPASSFEVCVTTDGVIGSFAGVVHGNRIELALTQYRGSVAADAFKPPANATLVDRRVPHS
jgi:hypothetical protein